MPISRSSRIYNPRSIERFRHSIESQVSVPEGEWEYLVPHLVERRFEKTDYLISAGDVANNFYFIIEGLVRFFYSTKDGKEFNKYFAMENGFAGSFHSLGLSIRSFYRHRADSSSRLWKEQIRWYCRTNCCVNSTSDIRAGSGLAVEMLKTWS